jgi:hypothetical protein
MKILGGIAIVAITVIIAFNVNLNSQSGELSDITLTDVEALAGEGLIDWWNSTVYDCVPEPCSFTFSLGIVSWTNYGTTHVCRDGSSVAHCWDCSGCDA